MIYQKDFFCSFSSTTESVAYTTEWLLDTFDFLTRVSTSKLAIAETDMEIYVTATGSTINVRLVPAGTTTQLSATSFSTASLYVFNLVFTDYCVVGWSQGASYPQFLFLTLENGSRAVAVGGNGSADRILDGQAVSNGSGAGTGICHDDSVYLYPALLRESSTGRLYKYQPAGNIWSVTSSWPGVNGAIYKDASGKYYMYCSNTRMLFGG